MIFLNLIVVISFIHSSSAGYWGSFTNFAEKYTMCQFGECCQQEYIKNEVPDFNLVFGQHLATAELKNAIGAFYKRAEGTKALVLSFHGTPGTGKNFVADQIVASRYKLGKTSKYVHGYSGRINFPLDELALTYSSELMHKILGEIRSCPYQTFVFDEVEKMPPGVFEHIVGLLDHNTFFKQADLSKSLFIFISNLGGVDISEKLSALMKKGYQREQTRLEHFEETLEKCAYNHQGGLQKSRTIEKAVIDYYIPFMPLEKRHVEMCITRLISRISHQPYPQILQKVLKSISYEGEFAASGCKKLEARVNAELHSEL